MNGIILGKTESGKSTLAKSLAEDLRRRGWGVITLDPCADPEWREVSSLVFEDADTFMRAVEASRRCWCFVDEAGDFCQYPPHDGLLWLARRGRHAPHYHSALYIAQRATMICPAIRGQARRLYCFEIAPPDARELARDWNRAELLEAPNLRRDNRGADFLVVDSLMVRRGRVEWKKRLQAAG